MAKANSLRVDIANQQSKVRVDRRQLRSAVQSILADAHLQSAEISIAIVDDATIHRLNRQYLRHDYPTDVLSFVLEKRRSHLEGEVIVSAETAARESWQHRWPALSEMLLYVVHGSLHLVGYNDKTVAGRAAMRELERFYLAQIGIPLVGGRLPSAAAARKGRRDASTKPE